MTRRHVAVTPAHERWARAGGVAYRNLGVEDSGDPLPDWITQGVELVLDAEERNAYLRCGQEWRQDSDDLAQTRTRVGEMLEDAISANAFEVPDLPPPSTSSPTGRRQLKVRSPTRRGRRRVRNRCEYNASLSQQVVGLLLVPRH